jgi:ubiquinone/menaquinone biosynthesis C-methylase UbiE
MNARTFKASSAAKLDDPERARWMPTGDVIAMLQLQSEMQIADIGAGTGYFSLPFAAAVGPAGKIWAVDFQPEMLAILEAKLREPGAPQNIETRQGEATATNLDAANCDLAFLANIWHELDDRDSVLRETARILKPDGRIAILDWRTDVERPPGPPLEHRVPAAAVAASLRAAGWRDVQTRTLGPYRYLVTAYCSSD